MRASWHNAYGANVGVWSEQVVGPAVTVDLRAASSHVEGRKRVETRGYDG